MLGLCERKFDNYVITLLSFTAEKVRASRSPNDQICAHTIPAFTLVALEVESHGEEDQFYRNECCK